MGASQSRGRARPAFRAETADDLRELIAEAERAVANLRGAGPGAEWLLYTLDAIHELVGRLKGTGLDLRPEAVRLETVERLLQAKDTVLLRELRRVGGLAAAREAAKPAPAQWWWYLDQHLAARRTRELRRALLVVGGVAAVLVVLYGLFRIVFPPDARRIAVLERTDRAEQLVEQGDLEGAAASYREAAAIMPEDLDLHVWIGVLEEQQGRGDAAAEAYARAEALAPDRAQYLTARGTAWLRLGAADRAQSDAEAALAASPDSAEACLLLASAYEAEGDARQAVAAFGRAAELAEKAGNSSLAVVARMRLGMLLQAAPPAGATPDE